MHLSLSFFPPSLSDCLLCYLGVPVFVPGAFCYSACVPLSFMLVCTSLSLVFCHSLFLSVLFLALDFFLTWVIKPCLLLLSCCICVLFAETHKTNKAMVLDPSSVSAHTQAKLGGKRLQSYCVYSHQMYNANKQYHGKWRTCDLTLLQSNCNQKTKGMWVWGHEIVMKNTLNPTGASITPWYKSVKTNKVY